jgi:DNA repair protein RecN (Recombination protein N)
MGKSASGGELSRLMLALELVAAERSSGAQRSPGEHHGDNDEGVFIFDEVDAGVGGKSAVELGRRLAQLARSAQVIVVTHLPQVASWADTQFVVSKGVFDAPVDETAAKLEGPETSGSRGNGESADRSENGGHLPSVQTVVQEVRGSQREREIARMLAGSESETSLRHARELLESSRL